MAENNFFSIFQFECDSVLMGNERKTQKEQSLEFFSFSSLGTASGALALSQKDLTVIYAWYYAGDFKYADNTYTKQDYYIGFDHKFV